MTLKEALKRIAELERKVQELQAQPKQEFHYHYHQPAPAYSLPTYVPNPQDPTWTYTGLGGTDHLWAR